MKTKKTVEYAVIEGKDILFRSRWKPSAKCFQWHYGGGQIVKMRITPKPRWMTNREDESAEADTVEAVCPAV